ncbi:MAG: hypothetical protein Q9224_006776 [Gallowayella concinna]
MPPYPSTYQIEEIFQDGEAVPQVLSGIVDHFDPKVKVTVVGHEHHLAGDTQAHGHFDFFSDLLDFSKPSKLQILRVIGGGESPWACVEGLATGTSKGGKKFHHEFAFIIRFNLGGKITKMRAYYDSAHMDEHVKVHHEHKAKNTN